MSIFYACWIKISNLGISSISGDILFSKKDFELIGIYEKNSVYSHACSVREIILEPINIEEYNKIITEKIEFHNNKINYLKNKIIKNDG